MSFADIRTKQSSLERRKKILGIFCMPQIKNAAHESGVHHSTAERRAL
jgi:hypothetical protein